jgi:O-antigen/teichoic acid export membrane protein
MQQIDLKKNILLSGISRFAIMIVAFLTGWLSTRFLGVELKGQYSYLITISSFTWIALDLGIHKTYPYLIRREGEKRNILFTWSLLQFAIEVVLLLGAGLALIGLWRKLLGFQFQPLHIALVAGVISLTKLSLHMQMYFLGQDKVKQNSLYQFGNSFVMLVLVAGGYLLLRDVNRLLYVLLSYNLAMLAAVIGYTHRDLFSRFWKGFDLRYVLRAYGMGWRVFLSSLFITLLIRFDVVIIKQLLGFKPLGIYALAANIVDMLQMAANMVGGLLLVKLSGIDEDEVRWRLLKKVFMVFFLLLGVANLAFAILGKPLLALLYGKPFVPVYGVYLWLIPASFGLAFGSLFNTYLWSKGFPLISVILPLLSLLANIALNYLLIPALGITGAALSTSIAYLLWFFLILGYEQRQSGGILLGRLIPSMSDWKALVLEGLNYGKALTRKRG